jgi:hypothetical protein
MTTPLSPSSSLQESTLLDLSALNALSQDQYQQFCSILFEYMINVPTNTTDEPKEKFSTLMSNEGLKKGYETLFYNLLQHLLGAVKHNRNSDFVLSSTKSQSLQEDYATQLKASFQRHLSVITTLFDENIFKLTRLLDLEWRFGVTTANSSLNAVGTCFLQLKLKTVQDGEEKDVIVEMTLSQFYAFLTQLQQAAADIQQA